MWIRQMVGVGRGTAEVDAGGDALAGPSRGSWPEAGALTARLLSNGKILASGVSWLPLEQGELSSAKHWEVPEVRKATDEREGRTRRHQRGIQSQVAWRLVGLPVLLDHSERGDRPRGTQDRHG